jgi:hypothetical protein
MRFRGLRLAGNCSFTVLRKVMEHNPPGAREHAAKCKLIAETAGSPTIQKTFFDVANKWVKLAEELDDARWLLNAVNELDAKAASRGIQSPVPCSNKLSADLPRLRSRVS